MTKQREQALLFLNKAKQDEALLDAVANAPGVSDEVYGFHCQQAAEKLLKAALSSRKVTFKRTHNLRVLADLLADAGHSLPAELGDLDRLTPFATLLRYESLPSDLTLDRSATRELLWKLRAWVEQVVAVGR